MQIRPATPEDSVGIVYVQATTWIKQYPNPDLSISEEDIRAVDWQGKVFGWQHMVKSPDYTVLTAIEGREVLGFGALNNTGEKTELYELDILPAHQKQGIGGKLLKNLMANSNGDVWLQVANYNRNAIGFYEYHGFKMTGERGAYLLPGGKHIPTVQMRYQLAPPASIAVEWVSRAELARRSGFRESTIKWYCEQGLIEFKQSEPGRRRYFDYFSCLERLRRIDELKGQDISLDDIRSGSY